MKKKLELKLINIKLRLRGSRDKVYSIAIPKNKTCEHQLDTFDLLQRNDTLDAIDVRDSDRHIYEHIDMARVIKSIASKAVFAESR